MTVKRALVKRGVPRRKVGRRRLCPKQRRCTVCKATKPIEAFAKEARRYSGYGYTCKECHRRKQSKRSITRFGITLDQFHELTRKQGKGCAICGQKMGHRRGRGGASTRLVIDHDHNTGEIRGLLCSRCNSALGLFEDRIDLMNYPAASCGVSKEPELLPMKLCVL